MYEKSLSMYTGIEQLSKYFPLLEKQLQISKGRKLNDPHGEKKLREGDSADKNQPRQGK